MLRHMAHLVTAVLLSVLLSGCESASLPAPCKHPVGSSKNVSVYFGCGCFWHMQHAFVLQEITELCRESSSLTARTAYGGGKNTGAGGLVCYHNMLGEADYGQMGHAEIVTMDVPEAKLSDFAKKFWELCPKGVRQDTQDTGGEYRSVIGIPGGLSSPLASALRAGATAELAKGRGNEDDTLGSGKVFVYDSTRFPAHVAEKYHQFHDDMMESYGSAYNALQKIAHSTKCPGDEGPSSIFN
eukprot:TRINITY_DN44831_c0_g1_i1.p1 TRINITY_DN44831_c0_g1~~TRINITY_DN44831_c0_g1_i1.p1  ORF type:complete len:241 (-),score=54.65 TRINITY_DN44831_c0_g1_i1:120-842(-)